VIAAVLAMALATAADAPDFASEVVPVLTKAGCNTGACHGAAAGRGGLRLSLFGADPAADYERLVLDHDGRRVDPSRPDRSLVLRKPSEDLPHEGGPRLAAGGRGYELVRDWIAAGAPIGPGRRLTRLRVEPEAITLGATGESAALRVTATFDDGREADVTRWAVYDPPDPAALGCSTGGRITARLRGRHALGVRFLGERAAVVVTVPFADSARSMDRDAESFIDDHIDRTLDDLGLPVAPQAGEAAWLRRAALDLNGRLPDPAEVEALIDDEQLGRRGRAVDRLMARPEFADRRAQRLGDLLRVDPSRLGKEPAAVYHGWIRSQVESGAPIDAVARALLTAGGEAATVGPANFSRVPADARDHAEQAARVLLGARLGCARCHDHPFDRWTQDDYHGLAALFARVGRGPKVELLSRGEVIHPRTGMAAAPRLPDGSGPAVGDDPRAALAGWLIDGPGRAAFARAAANRLWADLFGRGLVEPIDDLRPGNPATHPELLDALAADLADHGFDARRTLRLIATSAAYGRAAAEPTGEPDRDAAAVRFYAVAARRPLDPSARVDSVAFVTGVPEPLGAMLAGTAARELADPRVPSAVLDLLGRCDRSAAGCTARTGPAAGSVPLALHALHGPWLNAKLADPRGRLKTWIDAGRSDAEILRDFCRLALTRDPTPAELRGWASRLAEAGPEGRVGALEDWLWALLVCDEFVTNR